MKNSLTLLLLATLCFGLYAFHPPAWISVSLDGRVSVRTPAVPQETAMPAPAKLLSVKDTTGTYIILTVPLGKDFQGSERKQYYDSVLEGALESGKGQLDSRSAFMLGNYDGIDFTARVTRPANQQPMFVFVRCLIVDKKSYVLEFISTNDRKSSESQSKPFFESITLKPAAK
jgi:hypothetical protein